MALHSKKYIVTSSIVLNEWTVLKNSANVIKLEIIKSSALKAAVINNPINIHSTRPLASNALQRYCNAILRNCNAIFDFQITLF